MTTLAAIFIPLSLLQAATATTPPYTSPQLDIVGTDAIKDVINYFNRAKYSLVRHEKIKPFLAIPRLNDNYVIEKSSYNISASGGILTKDISVALTSQNPLKVVFTKSSNPFAEFHKLQADIPITFIDLKLNFESFEVEIDIKDTSRNVNQIKAPAVTEKVKLDQGAAQVLISHNEFVLKTELVHKISVKDGSTECLAGVRELEVQKFDVKKVLIENLPDVEETILNTLANRFKNSLLAKSYAAELIQGLTDTLLPHFLFYCKYVPYLQIKETEDA